MPNNIPAEPSFRIEVKKQTIGHIGPNYRAHLNCRLQLRDNKENPLGGY
jgi:hypothetical protein